MNPVLRRAADHYGRMYQSIMFMEESAELTKELSKNIRGAENVEQVAEEIADVKIMLEQLEYLFGCSDRTDIYLNYKINRLEARLDDEAKSMSEV